MEANRGTINGGGEHRSNKKRTRRPRGKGRSRVEGMNGVPSSSSPSLIYPFPSSSPLPSSIPSPLLLPFPLFSPSLIPSFFPSPLLYFPFLSLPLFSPSLLCCFESLSVCLYVYYLVLSECLCACLPCCLFAFLSACLSVFRSVCQSVFLSACLSIRVSHQNKPQYVGSFSQIKKIRLELVTRNVKEVICRGRNEGPLIPSNYIYSWYNPV